MSTDPLPLIKSKLIDFTLRPEQETLIESVLNRPVPVVASVHVSNFDVRRAGKTTAIVYAAIACALKYRQKVNIIAFCPDAVKYTIQCLIDACRTAQLSVVDGFEELLGVKGYDGEDLEFSVQEITYVIPESDAIYLYDISPLFARSVEMQTHIMVVDHDVKSIFHIQ